MRALATMLLLPSILTAAACHEPTPGASNPRAATKATAAEQPEVVLALRSGAEVHVAVELARNGGERAHGLMNRRSLEPGTGMLFLFPAPDHLKFWMRNTYIPLDMIFLSADRHVVFVEENAEPLNDKPRGPDEPSQFVLEVPGGWSRTHGIEPGVSAKFLHVP